MNIIITGASGFLGSNLSKELENQGHNLVKLDSENCDLTKDTSLSNFNDLRYELIFHLAAWTQAGDFCIYNPGKQWTVNQCINTNVLNWWQCDQPQAKLICMGTSCSYAPDLPLEEKNYLEGTPIESLYTYAHTKRMMYIGLKAIRKQFGLNYLCTVPSTLYGPGYHTDGRQMHFIFDLIRKIVKGKVFNETVILWGDGYQKRELVFVKDFVRALLQLSDKTDNNLVNIGAGEEFTIREYAKLICDKVEYDFEKIQFDTSKYVGAKSKCLDTKKFKAILPDFKATPLKEGLNNTIEWFFENQNTLLKSN